MYKGKKVGVVIPAAGEGVRVPGRVRKQFLEIAGKAIWVHTVDKFLQCREVDSVVVAAPADAVEDMKHEASTLTFEKLFAVVRGGNHRQHSVRLALNELQKFAPDLILVHDAVRPFVSHKVIQDVLEGAFIYQAAVPAVQSKETIKVSNGNSFVAVTPERRTLWVVQTPQGFHASLLYKAVAKAFDEDFYGTDDSSLVEQLGVKVKIVEGAYDNVKITTPEDLLFADFLIRK